MILFQSLYFDQIGNESARFHDLTIPLDDPATGDPADTLASIRNGGGKTSILSLLFSLLLPKSRQFIWQKTEGRTLGDYVLSADTSLVAARIVTPAGVVIVGAYYEWTDRRRPTEYQSKQGELVRHWFVFNPDPATLDFGSLPRLDDTGRLLTLRESTAVLEKISRANPRLRLTVSRNQTEYATALAGHGVNTSLLEAQLQVVGQEGGFEKLFAADSESDFVNRLIGLLYDDKAADSLALRIGQNSELLGRLPAVVLEQAFAYEFAERMDAVKGAAVASTDATTKFRQARNAADTLARSLHEAANASTTSTKAATNEAAAASLEITAGYATRTTEQNKHRAYRHLEARLRVERATEQRTLLETRLDEARTTARAWEAVDQVIAAATAEADVKRLRESELQLALGADVERAALARAASSYRSGLDTFLAAAQHRLAETISEEELASTELKRLTVSSGQLDERRQTNAVIIVQIEHQLREIDNEIRLAQTAGDLAATQTPTEALDHWRGAATTATSRLVHTRDDVRGVEEELTGLDVDERRFRDELTRVDEVQRSARDEWHMLEVSRSTLAAHETVREIVGATEVDLWAAESILVSRLHDRTTELETESGDLAAEQARAARTLDALSESGLLPPSENVRDVLDVLARAGVPAVAGYAYLARSIPVASRTAVIEAHPGLCAGVVVDPIHRDTARAAIAELRLTGLVVVGTKDRLEATNDTPHLVVAPIPAAYDPDAAPALRDEIEARVVALAARRAEVHAELTVARLLTEQLRAFFLAAPTSLTLSDARRALDEAVTAVETARRILEDLRARRSLLGTSLTELRASIEATSAILRDAERRADRVAPLAARHATVPDLSRRLGEATTARTKLESEHVVLGEELEEVEARRRTAVDTRSALRHDIEHHTRERVDVGEGLVEDVAGNVDLAELRRVWIAAGDELHRVVTDVALQTQIVAALRRAADEQSRLAGHGDEVVLRARELVENNRDATDASTRQSRLERARYAYERLLIEFDEAVRHLGIWSTNLAERPAPAGAGGTVPTLDDPDEAERRAEAASDAEDRIRADMAQLEKRRDELLVGAGELTNATERFTTAAASLEAAGADPTLVNAPAYAGTAGDAGPDAQSATRALVAAQEEVARWSATLKDRVQQARELPGVDRYASLSRNVTTSIAGLNVDILANADEATRQAAAWRVRAAELADEITRLDMHREICITDLAGEVTQLLARLARAEHVSKMPAGLGDWSGQAFLRIRFEKPQDDVEAFRTRIGDAIDRVITKKTKVDGLELLRIAVAAAVPKGFRSTVFKPTPDMRADRMPVTRLGAWSGGERLTAAVVLFCVIAAIRADRVGSRDFAPGALLIDNPLGQASFQPFVLLQRRIAELMGVQLIYTSAIKDLPALSVFPNVVRFSNLLSGDGRNYVLVDESAATPVRLLAKARISRTGSTPTLSRAVSFEPALFDLTSTDVVK